MPMTARARVEAQIGHQETDFIPFAKLAFEGDVAQRLDASFGGTGWRQTVDALNHIHEITDEAPLREWREPTPGEGGHGRLSDRPLWLRLADGHTASSPRAADPSGAQPLGIPGSQCR